MLSIFSRAYWREAAKNFSRSKFLVFAALICALRIAVKAIKIPIIPGVLSISFDAYVNALGSVVYGPLVGLAVGAVSDTIGAVIFPSGPYFLPFILVEMSSSFLFGLFLWRKKLSPPRVILAKFTVSFVCNIILTSLFMKWMYVFFGIEKTYYFINGARIVKNLVLVPLEGTLIVLLLNAFLPAFRHMGFVSEGQKGLSLHKKDVLLIVLLALLSVALVLFYFLFLKDWIAQHNIKWF